MEEATNPVDAATEAAAANGYTIRPADGFTIRPYCPTDRACVYRVCLQTGNAGKDASHMYATAPDALGERWTGPYVTMRGCIALILEDAEGVCGYVECSCQHTALIHGVVKATSSHWADASQTPQRE